METEDLNNIFGDSSPGTENDLLKSEDILAREWEEMQTDIPEIEDISLRLKDFPDANEIKDIKSNVNHSISHNSAFQGIGIMLSVVSAVVLSVAVFVNFKEEKVAVRQKEKITLKQYSKTKNERVLDLNTAQNKSGNEKNNADRNDNRKAELKLSSEKREIENFEFVRAKKLNQLVDVPTEMDRRFENYLFDDNFKYMHNYKIYNYESRLAPPETLSVTSLTPKFNHGWNHYRVPRDVIFSNRVYEDMLEKAFKYMKKERYIEVNLILMSILEKFPMDQNAWFYLGISKYRQEDYEGAQVCFEKIGDDYPAVFKPESEWYKSLCLLNSGNVESAKEDLQRIAERSGFYQKRAASLLANKLKD